MGSPDDRDRGGEDLFEDLDKFFAPIDEVEWPEGEEGAERVALPESHEEEVVIDLGETVPESVQPPAAESSMRPIVPGRAGAGDAVAFASGGDAGDAGGPSEGREQPTREMSGEDWRRLREVLGDDEDEDSPPSPAAPSTTDAVLGEPPEESDPFPAEEMEADARAAWGPEAESPGERAEAAEEPRGDLTLDDLKKPPREYV